MVPPNVLLVVADSVRAQNTTLHGHHRDTTPVLDSLAESATMYEQARAPANWSLPSHTSMFTGYHVREHRVTNAEDGIEPGETIFDELQEDGYNTAVFSENPYLTSLKTGLASGFDTVEGAVQEQPFEGLNPNEYKGQLSRFLRDAISSGAPVRSVANGIISKVAWDYPALIPVRLRRKLSSGVTPGSTYTTLFQDWVAEQTAPWAACINYMDAHHPYVPQAEYDEWDNGAIRSVQDSISSMPLGFYTGEDPWWKCEVLEHLYDGTIRQVDAEIGRVIQFLEDRGELSETLIVVTSDHGEGFGERSEVRGERLAGHNLGEHEVNLHVPLVVKEPGQKRPTRETAPVSLTAIPSIVSRVVGNDSSYRSVSELDVLAQTQGPLDDQMETLEESGIDLAAFRGQADVLYETLDGAVEKCVSWKDNRFSTVLPDSSTTEVATDCSSLDDVLDRVEHAGIKAERVSERLDAETAKHLENLGYR